MIFLNERVRSPVAEGWFYPEEAPDVAAQICSFGLEQGQGGTAQAILAPHGAWNVSGAVAGRAFTAAAGRELDWPGSRNILQVVLLGAIHDETEEGVFLSDSAFFRTPLGNLPVDTKSSLALASSSPFFKFDDIPHLQEHSLEVLLPLVKYCFPLCRIVPILMGNPNPALIPDLARSLELVFKRNLNRTLFVISSSLSRHPKGETARLQAEECVRLLQGKNVPGLAKGIAAGTISACGALLAASLLKSGLLEKGEVSLLSSSLVKTNDEKGFTVYYGALSFS